MTNTEQHAGCIVRAEHTLRRERERHVGYFDGVHVGADRTVIGVRGMREALRGVPSACVIIGARKATQPSSNVSLGESCINALVPTEATVL